MKHEMTVDSAVSQHTKAVRQIFSLPRFHVASGLRRAEGHGLLLSTAAGHVAVREVAPDEVAGIDVAGHGLLRRSRTLLW